MEVRIDTYEELLLWAKAFGDKHLNLLILIGSGGTQKSTIFREAAPAARIVEGAVTPFEFYCELWRHRDKQFIVDDVDALYENKAAVRLLKCLCQTTHDGVKSVAWHTAAQLLVKQNIPKEFKTGSQLAIIANEWHLLNKNIGAVQDRGTLIRFEPSAEEVHKRAKLFFDDKEVYDFIGEYIGLIPQPSLRYYVHAKQLKQINIDWKKVLLETWKQSIDVITVIKLVHDESFSSEKDRWMEFERVTGKSRSTYFRVKQELKL